MSPNGAPTLVEDARATMGDLLAAMAQGSPVQRAQLAQSLHPQPDDFARVFAPAAVPTMRTHFQRVFEQNPVPGPKEGQSEVKLFVALAGLLREDSPISRRFPGGYRRLAPFLLPLVPWATWSFHSGDPTRGMRYDGLVALDARLIWLPKAYRLLKRS